MLVKHWLQNLFPRFRFPGAAKRREFAQKRKAQRDGGQSVGIVQVAESLEDRTLLAAAITGFQNDNGPFNNDGVTNDVAVDVQGEADEGTTVEVFVDGVSKGTTTASGTLGNGGTGTWSFALSTFVPADNTPYPITAAQTTGVMTVSAASNVTVETVAPTVSIDGPAGMTGAAPFTATFTFSEPTYGFTAGDISVGNGTVSLVPADFTGADGATVFTAKVTPSANGTVTVDVAAGKATDLAGNNNLVANQFDVTADITPPSATITGPTGPTNSNSLAMNLDFGEAVTGLTLAEIVVGNGTASNLTGGALGVYTFDVVPTADGTVTVDVAAGVAQDSFGNGNTVATQYSVVIDTTGPGITIGAPDMADVNSSDTIDFDISYSDLQGGTVDLESVDITLNSTGTAGGNVAVVGGNTANPIVRITNATGDGTLSISIGPSTAQDGLGNQSLVAGPSATFNVDNTAPVVVIGTPDDSLVNDSGTVNFPVTITGGDTFNLTSGDITLISTTGGTQTVTILDGGTAAPTIRITGATGDGTITVSVNAGKSSDLAGNVDIGAGPSAAITVDNTDPTVAITGPASPTSTTPFEATITFTEVMVGFAASDLTVTNGTAGNLQTEDNQTFTVDITPTANGNVTVALAAAVATDEAENDNEAAPTNYVVEFIDPVNPIITGTAGDDLIDVSRDGGGNIVVLRNGDTIFSQAEAGVATMQVNGGDGDDNLAINVDSGINFPITYDGEGNTAAGDTLTLSGASGGDVTHTFVDDNSGSVAAGANSVITYSGIEPIDDNMIAANRIFTFTGASETITLSDDGDAGDGESFIDSNLGESVTFTNPTGSLTVNSSNGTDILEVEGLDSSFSAPITLSLGADDTIRFQTNATNTGTKAITATADDIQVNGVTLTTQGTLTGDVVINATGSVVATGTLDIGGGSSSGVNLAGTLDVGSHTVNLLDSNLAFLGTSTTINNGTLNAVGGIHIGLGDTLSGNGSVAGPITGSSGSTITADGTLSLGDAGGYNNAGTLNVGNHTVTLLASALAQLGSSTTLDDGTLNAANGVSLSIGDVISGAGTINGKVITNSGAITPGNPIGQLNVVGNLDGSGNGIFNIEIDNVITPGTDFDQVAVTGTVDVTDATLNLSGSYTGGALGETIVLVDNDGTDAVIGEFTGLSNGDDIAFGGGTWRLFYDGGNGNDIVLTFVPDLLPEIFVNNDRTEPNGTLIADADPNTGAVELGVIGVNVFDTIQEGVDAVDVDGQVSVTDAAGDTHTYLEEVTIGKSLALVGTSGTAGHVTITNTAGTGITVNPTAAWVEIDSLTVTGNGANGIWVGALTGDVDITNVVTTNNTTNGININGADGTITLTDVTATGNNRGFDINNVSNLTLNDTEVSSNTVDSLADTISGSLSISTDPGGTADDVQINTAAVGGTGFIGVDQGGTTQNLINFTGVADIDVQLLGADDTATVAPHVTTTISIDGGAPTNTLPGDKLTYLTPTGETSTLTLDGADAENDAATISVTGGFADVSYNDIEDLTFSGSIVVNGTADDDLLVITATNPTDGTFQVTTAGVAGPTINFTGATDFTFNGGDGDDILRINNPASGLFAPAGGIFFNGEGQAGDAAFNPDGDALEVLGGTAVTVEHVITNEADGSIAYDGMTTITYTGLEPVLDTITATNRIFTFTSVADETITLSDDAGVGLSVIDSTDGEAITFLAPNDSLLINTEVSGGAGADTVDVQGVDSTFDADLTVASGTDDAVDFTMTPTDIGAGELTVTSGSISVDANVTTTGDVTLNATQTGIDGTGTLSGADLVANAVDGIQLNTTVDDIDASVSGTGDITIVETDGVVLSDVDTSNGSITVEAGGQIDAVDVIAGGAGDVDISNTAGDILVDDVQAVGETLTITSTAGAIEEMGADPAADLIADDMNLTAANGIGQAAQIEIDASAAGGMGLTAEVTGTGMIDLSDITGGLRVLSAITNDGDIRIISNGNLLLETVDAGAASDVFGQSINGNVTAGDVQAVDDTVTLMSAGTIEEEGTDGDADITAAKVILTAQTGIGAADTLEVDAGDAAPNGLSAEVINIGNIDISDPNGLRVILAETDDGSIDLATTGTGDLTLEEVVAGGVNDVTATAADGDILVTEVNADGDLATLTASGSILDNGDAAVDVTAADLIATATAGTIGTGADALETSVDNLEATAGGGIWIDNDQSLTIGGIGATVGVSAGDNIVINANGFIDVTEDVTNTSGNIDLNAIDSAGGGDNVTVRTGTTVTSDAGDVNLRGGDDVIIENDSSVEAPAGKVSLWADAGNADPGVGGSIRVLGTLVSSDQAMAMGGPDGDFIQIKPGVNDTVDSIMADGKDGDDIYEIWYGRLDGGANAVDIRDSGTGNKDSATVIGTAADETIIVHNNEANGVGPVTGGFSDNTTTGENVTYSETLERLTVRGEDGNELFDVQPSQSTIITIDGGAPGFGDPNAPGGDPDGPGDILDLDTFDQTFTIVGKSIFTNGGDPDAFERINFRRIEGLPLDPIGTSGDPDPLRFDFDTYSDVTQAGYTSVESGRLYDGPDAVVGSDFGWVDTASNSHSLTNSSVFLNDLFVDHHFDTTDRTFRVDVDNGWYLVSAKIGDQGSAFDTISVTNADTGDLLLSDYETDHQIGTVTFPVLVQDGTMDLTFSGAGGVNDVWSLNALGIRPGNLLTFGSPDPNNLEADGVTIDTFQGFDATPNSVITLYAGLDSDGDDIPDIDLEIISPDLDPIIDGVQVMANANGEFSYDIVRPTGTGMGFVAMSELSGDQTGCLSINYVGANVRRFDFDGWQDSTELPSAAPGGDESDFISVSDSNDPELSRFEYDSTYGFGWLDGSNTYSASRGVGNVTGTSLPRLLQDIHYGVAPQTFRADLAEGEYEVTITFGDPSAAATVSAGVVVGNLVSEQANVTDVEYSYDETHRTFVVHTQNVGGKDQIQLEFSSPSSFWSVAGVSFREVSEVVELAVTPQGAVVETADGVSVATVRVEDATPGDVYTLATTRGTITQLEGIPVVDVDTELQGIQIVAPAANFTFGIQSPVGTGDATITVEEINGAARGNAVQAYEGPSVQGFDFDTYSQVTAAGFTASQSIVPFMPGDSSGWLGNQTVFTYDSGYATATTPDLYRDGVYGFGSPASGARTFRVAVNMLQNYDLRVYSGSQVFSVDNMMISVEGGMFTAMAANTASRSFTDTVLSGVSDQNADGFLDITFSDLGGANTIWFANGIELADAGTLAAPAPLTFSGSQGAGANDVTVDQVGTLVDAAIDRLVDAGYDASAFDDVTVEVADLDDQGVVGLAGNGVVTIDNDGFGHGWFLDDTPFDDSEFDLYIGGSESQATGGAANGKVDLLTVLMHELAHIAGAEDIDTEVRPHNLMTATIGTSTRRLA